MTEAAPASPPGHVFVIAAPSGTGKTTLCRHLLERDPRLRLSVSHTTRPMRKREVDGVDYHFVSSKKAFRELTDEGAFLEHAEYNSNLYGTSLAALEVSLAAGEDARGAARSSTRILAHTSCRGATGAGLANRPSAASHGIAPRSQFRVCRLARGT